MPKRYLVTGCAGFIAARVCELLLDAGHAVVGWDELNDAYDPSLKEWRLARLRDRSGFSFCRIDVSQAEAVREWFARGAPDAPIPSADRPPYDAVINLAARAGVRASVARPDIYYQANCIGTLVLLEQCRTAAVRKFILASTSSLYGAHNPVPYREDADTDRPLSPYAASKKAAETLAYTYHYLHGLDVTVFRYFTVYGPAGRPDMSIFRFVRQISEGEPITVFGDGSQRRDFTYVDDIARGTVAGLKEVGYEVINLGGDRSVPLSFVIEEISRQCGREACIEYRPAHPADVPATWADVAKARSLLDWNPEIPIEEGIRRCIAWYREHRETMRHIRL
ncbi:NAD-dependent epimerase/dehydratase family protein [Thermopirellula anaerolimosa]